MRTSRKYKAVFDSEHIFYHTRDQDKHSKASSGKSVYNMECVINENKVINLIFCTAEESLTISIEFDCLERLNSDIRKLLESCK